MRPTRDVIEAALGEGLSHRQLGERFGVSPWTAREWARGVRKGTCPATPATPNKALSVATVAAIKREIAGGGTYQSAAKKLGIGVTTAWRVARGLRGSDVKVAGFEKVNNITAHPAAAEVREELKETRAQLALALWWGSMMSEEMAAIRAHAAPLLVPCAGGERYDTGPVVYFLHYSNGSTKVGWSDALDRRLRDHHGSAPGEIVLLSMVRGTMEDEAAWHRKLAADRTHHEFFRLTQDQIPPTDFNVAPLNEERTRCGLRKTCATCGKSYVAKIAHQVSCGPRCSYRRRAKPVRRSVVSVERALAGKSGPQTFHVRFSAAEKAALGARPGVWLRALIHSAVGIEPLPGYFSGRRPTSQRTVSVTLEMPVYEAAVRAAHEAKSWSVQEWVRTVASGAAAPLVGPARSLASLGIVPPQRPIGEANSRCKLTDAQVIEIRARRAAGEKLVPLGDEFGVSHSVIRDVTSPESRRAR